MLSHCPSCLDSYDRLVKFPLTGKGGVLCCCVLWSYSRGKGLTSWPPLTGLRGGSLWTSEGFWRQEGQVLYLTLDNHKHGFTWAKRRLKAALSRRTWGYWWMKNWIWACDVHSQPRKTTTCWVAPKAAWPTGWEDVIPPLCSSHETLTWSPASSSKVPNVWNVWTCWGMSSGGPWYDQRLELADLWREADRDGAVQPGEESRATLEQLSDA